ncbi:MAG: apolipoprotein N-acyltransferase [Polyangiales bacterium]
MTARRVGLGAAAGLSLALAMPPFGATPLCSLTFGLLAASLHRATPRQARRAWLAAGVVAFAVTGAWLVETVARFTGAPLALGALCLGVASLWMGAAMGLAGDLAARARPALGGPLAATAATWAALRYGPRVFPYPLALPLIDAPRLAQAADLVGVEGLGAALVGLAALAFEGVAARRPRGLVVALACLLALVGYGGARLEQVRDARSRAASLAVALVQPVVGAAARWDPSAQRAIHARLDALTREGAQGAALTVWHEAAFPYELSTRAAIDGEVAPQALPGWSGALLFGAMARGPARRYNAVFLRDADGAWPAPVAKRRLLPFGEYVPVAAWHDGLHAAVTGGGGVSPGERPQRISLGRNEIGVMNCFEDTLPDAGAELDGVDLLVNVTNDAWFDAANNDQHLLASRWRAIELRRDLVRASNTGRSAHVDASGAIVAVAPQGVMTVLRATPKVALGLHAAAPRVIVWGPRGALALLIVACWLGRRAGSESK